MRFNVIKELFLTNLLYSFSPQRIKYRKKFSEKNDIRHNLFKNLLIMNLVNFLNILFVFSIFSYGFNFSGPGYRSILFFILLMVFIQILNNFTNMFYESDDTLSIIHLPVTGAEIFFSKLFTLLSLVISNFIPLIVINLIIGLNAEFSIQKFLFILVYSFAFIITLLCSIMTILSFITYIPNFKKNKGKVNAATILIALIVFTGGIFDFAHVTKNIGSEYSGDIFLNILVLDISKTYTYLIITIILAIISFFTTYIFVVKKYMKDLYRISGNTYTSSSKTVKIKENTNSTSTTLFSKLIKRNLKLLLNSTISTTVFTNLIITLGIFVIPIIEIRKHGGIALPLIFYPVAMTIGFTLALYINSNPMNFTSIAISLEKQDYYFLKSLPLDFKKYLKIKLAIATCLQLSFGLFALIMMLIITKTPILLAIVTIISYIISSIVFSFYSYTSDYKKLYLNWNTITDLANRSSINQVLLTILAFGAILLLVLLNVVTFFLIAMVPSSANIVGIIYSLILIILLILATRKLRKNVFDKIYS